MAIGSNLSSYDRRQPCRRRDKHKSRLSAARWTKIVDSLPGSAKGPVTQSGKVDKSDDKKDGEKDRSA